MRSLRPYQTKAKDFLLDRQYAGLFADMGMGKTAGTLHAMVGFPKPILLIGPIRVIEDVWRAEAALWPETQGLTFSLVRGPVKARARALATPADVYLVNPELVDEVLASEVPFASLVVDESSMYKSPSTKRFKSLRKARKRFQKIVILTGTPSPNSLMDLWSQIYLLDGGTRLGTSFFMFRNIFFNQTDYMGYSFEPKPGAVEKVSRLISDIVLRIEAKGNLPPREVLHNRITVDLPPKARTHYDEMAKDAFSRIASEDVSAGSAVTVLTKLRQMASGFVYGDDGATVEVHREKIKALESIMDETGSPVIVVYQFRHELQALKAAFPQGLELADVKMDDWNSKKIPMMFLHPQSGGHGLNLQYGSHTMVIFSASFSYEHMAQTKARIDRQGQECPVIFHEIVARDTVDDLLLEALDRKSSDQSRILDLVKAHAQKHGR